MKTSNHGVIRQQQRGIPSSIVDLVLDYGRRAYDHHGGVVRYLDRRSRKQIETTVGREFMKRHGDYMDVYVVQSASDGSVITCGHRFAKINRN